MTCVQLQYSYTTIKTTVPTCCTVQTNIRLKIKKSTMAAGQGHKFHIFFYGMVLNYNNKRYNNTCRSLYNIMKLNFYASRIYMLDISKF